MPESGLRTALCILAGRKELNELDMRFFWDKIVASFCDWVYDIPSGNMDDIRSHSIC